MFEPRLNCDLNFVLRGLVSDRSLTRPGPLVRLLNLVFVLSQATTQSLIHINEPLNETAHCANGSLINILGVALNEKNWT